MERKQAIRDGKPTRERRNRARLLWGLGLAAVVSGLAGAAVAVLMETGGKPLQAVSLDRPLSILVLGIDNSERADSDHNPTSAQALAGNSDTMLLVRLLPDTHQVNILSIPRDTLVQLPSGQIDKVNDMNVKGGAPLAIETVSHLLNDVSIDRYLRVSTSGFIELVDALGGVEVTIPKPMDYVDHTQHLNIHFLPGQQTLDGQHLQEYVRFRHDELGDIGRVQRQQTVLKALLHRLAQPATLLRLPQLLQVVQKNAESNLTPQELLGLAQFLRTLDRKHVNLVMLPGRFSRPDEYAVSYWIADPQAATPILARYFGPFDDQGFVAQATPAMGQLKIAIVNDTNQPELGTAALSLLRQCGFSNSYLSQPDLTDASRPLTTTHVIAQHGNPEAAVAVVKAFGLGQVEVESTGELEADLTVKLGTDWATQLNSKDASLR